MSAELALLRDGKGIIVAHLPRPAVSDLPVVLTRMLEDASRYFGVNENAPIEFSLVQEDGEYQHGMFQCGMVTRMVP